MTPPSRSPLRPSSATILIMITRIQFIIYHQGAAVWRPVHDAR